IDKLGAVMEYRILGYMADENISFISEVTRRTPMDKKGGHLGTKTDGNLMLRDTAQCPEEELDKFMDIEYFRYFNINNIWMNLKCLKKELEKQGGFFRLPLIKNKKTVNPVDPESAKVIQVESTVGSGIQFFNGASAIEVPRSRFLPVKSTSDLLLVCSDLYDYNEKTGMLSAREEASAGRAYIELDKKFFGRMKDFSERFPSGFPSLKKCRSFKVSGPFVFGRGTIVEGEVSLVNNSNKNIHIPEGTRLHPGSSAADFGS
ncbi:MAG: UTP--glucose-1-phosphate uridylyltransferase, partial [Fibrobacterota bacterium]